MIDIVEITDDLQLFDSSVSKAKNVLSVQLGSLTYAPDFGVDLRYFLTENFEFQNEAFKSYLLKRLAESSIDVSSVLDTVEALFSKYTFNLAQNKQGTGFVR